MLYYNFTVGDKTYKLTLTTSDTVELEKAIGMNPIMIFGTDGESIPTITTMVSILHCSLQKYQHGITLRDTYDIFDNYIADGHLPIEFIKDIVGIYKVSGLMREDTSEEKN